MTLYFNIHNLLESSDDSEKFVKLNQEDQGLFSVDFEGDNSSTAKSYEEINVGSWDGVGVVVESDCGEFGIWDASITIKNGDYIVEGYSGCSGSGSFISSRFNSNGEILGSTITINPNSKDNGELSAATNSFKLKSIFIEPLNEKSYELIKNSFSDNIFIKENPFSSIIESYSMMKDGLISVSEFVLLVHSEGFQVNSFSYTSNKFTLTKDQEDGKIKFLDIYKTHSGEWLVK